MTDPDLHRHARSPYFLGAWYPEDEPARPSSGSPRNHAMPRSTSIRPRACRCTRPSITAQSSPRITGCSITRKLRNVGAENTLVQLLYNVPPLFHLSTGTLPRRLPEIVRHDAFFRPLHARLATQALVGFSWLTPDRRAAHGVRGWEHPGRQLPRGGLSLGDMAIPGGSIAVFLPGPPAPPSIAPSRRGADFRPAGFPETMAVSVRFPPWLHVANLPPPLDDASRAHAERTAAHLRSAIALRGRLAVFRPLDGPGACTRRAWATTPPAAANLARTSRRRKPACRRRLRHRARADPALRAQALARQVAQVLRPDRHADHPRVRRRQRRARRAGLLPAWTTTAWRVHTASSKSPPTCASASRRAWRCTATACRWLDRAARGVRRLRAGQRSAGRHVRLRCSRWGDDRRPSWSAVSWRWTRRAISSGRPSRAAGAWRRPWPPPHAQPATATCPRSTCRARPGCAPWAVGWNAAPRC